MLTGPEQKRYRGWDEVNNKYVYGSLYIDSNKRCYILEPAPEGEIPKMTRIPICYISELVLHRVISEDSENSLYAGKEVYVYDDDIININGFVGHIERLGITYGILDDTGDMYNGQEYPEFINQQDYWPLLKILEEGGKIIERHYVGYPESHFRYWVHPRFEVTKADDLENDPESKDLIVSIWDGNFPKYCALLTEDDERMRLVSENKIEEFYNSCDYECDWFEHDFEWYDWITEKKLKELY